MKTNNQTLDAIATALQARIGQPMPMNNLKVYTEDENRLQWGTCSSETPVSNQVDMFILERSEYIQTDNGIVTGYYWGSDIINKDSDQQTWREFLEIVVE